MYLSIGFSKICNFLKRHNCSFSLLYVWRWRVRFLPNLPELSYNLLTFGGCRGTRTLDSRIKSAVFYHWTTHPYIVEQKFLSSTLASSVQVPSLNIIIIAHLVRFVKRYFEIFSKYFWCVHQGFRNPFALVTEAFPLPPWHYLLYTNYRKMSSSNFVQVLIWKFV